MKDKIYNRVKIQINENVFKEKPKILIALKPNISKSVLRALKNHLKDQTGVTFVIEDVPYHYFGDATSTKEKIIEYVDKK